MLKQGSIQTACDSERSIVFVEMLKKTETDLIHTLEETLKIQKGRRTKRQNAERVLMKLEVELTEKMKELA